MCSINFTNILVQGIIAYIAYKTEESSHMANKYTIGKDLSDSFDYGVELDGKLNSYTVKYPSQKQLRPIQIGYARLQELDKEYSKLSDEDKAKKAKIENEVKKVSESITSAFSALFQPHEGAMPLEEMLDNLPSNKKHVFDLMIQAELLDSADARQELAQLGM